MLGGLQLLDLTPEGRRHQKIVSVGQDPNLSVLHLELLNMAKPDTHQTALDEAALLYGAGGGAVGGQNIERAFTVSVTSRCDGGGGLRNNTPVVTPATPLAGSQFDAASDDTDAASLLGASDDTRIKLRMASLIYTHSPLFLRELSLCIIAFTEYLVNVGDSLKTAAHEVALNLVNTNANNQSFQSVAAATTHDVVTAAAAATIVSDVTTSISSPAAQPPPPSQQRPALNKNDSLLDKSLSAFKIDAHFQTPVIVLPRAPDSAHILVGQLGKISVQNYDSALLDRSLESSVMLDSMEQIYVGIRDVSVYSIDIAALKLQGDSLFYAADGGGATVDGAEQHSAASQHSRHVHGTPIVHDTEIQFSLQKLRTPLEAPSQPSEVKDDDELFRMDDVTSAAAQQQPADAAVQERLLISGKVVTPLKVVLSKQVFEQVKDTLDNIAIPDDDDVIVTSLLSASGASDAATHSHAASATGQPSARSQHSTSGSTSGGRDRSQAADASPAAAGAATVEPPQLIQANFELPTLCINMTGDVGDGEQGLVELQLQDFKVAFEAVDSYSKDLEISLQSLVMDDLLQRPSSRHRHLMVSYSLDSLSSRLTNKSTMPISNSCPSHMVDLPKLDMPPSLPNSLHKDNVWDSVYEYRPQKNRQKLR